MTTVILPQFEGTEINIALYENVKNSKEIRAKIADLPYALIDAKAIISGEQLLSAIHRALIEVNYNKMRTKSLHSECLLCLSPTSNIGDAFKKFGILDNSTSIIAVHIGAKKEEINYDFIQGTCIEFTDENLGRLADKDYISKIYKLEKTFRPETNSDLSRAVVDAILLRGL
ncbi:hypothetical protein KAFR_0C05680 [Kazachstania africana CBS 2517]|uniref:EKC/KEOPS complex subunit CGI121 n=1 Tax=Kazachstania africana (strain ATCC 22294 / BCRC 22015 / CBS 2517 / CECT 1963 / NBRC 1671 / NRRL Y-8276) TaxID=1071382 RepID=H2AT59_KAZAF|nr:hypothetical protein KAFR_0C05680 [Kazachstania africana CBS 2517]CCF57559.1 hypothetical protein KAFR_0C05680 [Kazachstania africana CBS 2517]